MSEVKTAIQVNGPREGTLKWYLDQPGYRRRFEQMLGKRSTQFCASIINVASAKNFERVQPQSIIAAAAIAATLDLPIEKSLGFAWVIPYGNMAQFQIGWKGVVQLAIRSGQYAKMNAFTVNAEALGGFDDVGEPVIIWENLDETKEPVGYAFAWKLIGGFSKIVYWSKKKVEAHAKKYSQAYKAGRKDSPWFSDFDKMALKTVIMNSLRSWGILSVEMRQAVDMDQTAAIDIEASPVYLDNLNDEAGDAEPPNGNRGDALAERLKNEPLDTSATIEPPQREPGEEEEEPFRESLSRYRDAFAVATDELGRNKALATAGLYFTAPPDKATDEQLAAATDGLKAVVAEHLRPAPTKKK